MADQPVDQRDLQRLKGDATPAATVTATHAVSAQLLAMVIGFCASVATTGLQGRPFHLVGEATVGVLAGLALCYVPAVCVAAGGSRAGWRDVWPALLAAALASFGGLSPRPAVGVAMLATFGVFKQFIPSHPSRPEPAP